MKTITLSIFQKQLKLSLDKVRNNGKPLIVDCGNDGDIVIISKTEYDHMEDFSIGLRNLLIRIKNLSLKTKTNNSHASAFSATFLRRYLPGALPFLERY